MEEYYRVIDGIKIYYEKGGTRIGTEFEMVKHIIFSRKVSSSKAHKMVSKIKENKNVQ